MMHGSQHTEEMVSLGLSDRAHCGRSQEHSKPGVTWVGFWVRGIGLEDMFADATEEKLLEGHGVLNLNSSPASLCASDRTNQFLV